MTSSPSLSVTAAWLSRNPTRWWSTTLWRSCRRGNAAHRPLRAISRSEMLSRTRSAQGAVDPVNQQKGAAAMKVLILGAGASKPACYPLASELMLTIETDAKASRNIMLMNAWEHWETTKKAAPGALRRLLEDPNPEVVLSVLDLCAISGAMSDCGIMLENRPEFVGDVLSDPAVSDDRFMSLDHKWLDDADTARYRVLDRLISYFEWRHHSDRESFQRRAYLREEVDKLRAGDVVITLNWDTLAERSLWEADRWSPRDGYGFPTDLRRADGLDPVSGRLSKPSE